MSDATPPEITGWTLFALILWAELRALPFVLDALGWLKATGTKAGVTPEEAAAQRPKAWSLRRGAALLVVAIVLVGCSGAQLRSHLQKLDDAWRDYRSSVAPTTTAQADLAGAMDDAVRAARKSAE